jgi:hypothetical protein
LVDGMGWGTDCAAPGEEGDEGQAHSTAYQDQGAPGEMSLGWGLQGWIEVRWRGWRHESAWRSQGWASKVEAWEAGAGWIAWESEDGIRGKCWVRGS